MYVHCSCSGYAGINVRSLFLFWFCWLPWFLKGFWFPCCAGFVHSLLK
ncbi:hypothetical protein HanXRQr2_Chr02g0081211 [Helianthus annuus]|uniref:Uncharacterized protein n=1 Tax=Helianthus annuus TaxID=4232 RepID=A0A9K3JR70_HELAN|nr:hypothetical protein HanXRQr2_Chr02g0081211 [Helianthus annuus]